ncbi:MAG: mechanosensitive ion channel domain-containing protein, partial [Tahibacter sp.]
LRQRWLKDLLPAADLPPAVAANSATNLPPSHAAGIEAARNALSQTRELNTAQLKDAGDTLTAAAADEQLADQIGTDWRALRGIAARAENDAQQLEQNTARDRTATMLAWRASLPERASVEQLEAQLASERAALTDARTSSTALQSEVSRELERPGQIRDELKTAQLTLADAERAPPAHDASTPALEEILRLRRQSTTRLAQTRVAKLEEELRSYDVRLRLLTARLRDRQRETADRQQKVEALQNLILDRSSAVVAALNARLDHEADEAAVEGASLTEVARLNQQFGLEEARTISRLAELHTLKDEYSKAQRGTAEALKNTRARIDIGVSEAVGLILLSERRKLQSVPALKRKLAGIESELVQARIRLIDLRETSTGMDDPAQRVSAELQRLPDTDAATRTRQREVLYRLIATRAELLPQLTVLQTRLAEALAETEQDLRALTNVSTELRDLLDARLLWIPSHAPVGRTWPSEIFTGLLDVLTPQRWWDSLRAVAAQAFGRPFASLAGISILVALSLLRRRVKTALETIAAPMRRIRTDRYRLTGRALLLSLVASFWAPTLLWFAARLCQRAAETGQAFSDALALAFGDLVIPAAALSFLGWISVDRGLASAHFRWTQARRTSLRRIQLWMSCALLPAQFFLALYFYSAEQVSNAGLARFVFVGAGLLLSWLAWRELAPGALWSPRTAVTEPVRFRQLLRLGISGFALAVCGLALSGYFLTATTLTARLVESAGVLLIAATLHGMALRWLTLGERRLALKRMEEKRGQEPAREDEDLETRPDFAAEAEQISLASINQQTRRLLRALTAVFLVGALLWVWSDFIPALAYLGETAAWHSSYQVEGKEIAVIVTLRALLFAGVALALTWIATRNLPGLLEIGVLRRLQVDAPTRYAITAVCRYAIAIFGTAFGLSLLGLRWGQLQWMAAALSVGLGFGLQEIFANFVSGLIVLFERPIRVGDVISVRGIEGTVTRIRTRATTVVDWDNKEVVIPNKTFITEQLTNWTLSDSITRIVIKLGVAYASDTDQVRSMLLDLARAQSKVLREPGPNCWCVALGNSAVEFELRVFVGDVLERNPVRNELHTTILRECRARGIELAFPQMDVWLRNPPEPVALPGTPSAVSRADPDPSGASP